MEPNGKSNTRRAWQQERIRNEQRFRQQQSQQKTKAPDKKDIVRAMFGTVTTKEQLNVKHRQLQKILHPDNNGGDRDMYMAMEAVYEELLKTVR